MILKQFARKYSFSIVRYETKWPPSAEHFSLPPCDGAHCRQLRVTSCVCFQLPSYRRRRRRRRRRLKTTHSTGVELLRRHDHSNITERAAHVRYLTDQQPPPPTTDSLRRHSHPHLRVCDKQFIFLQCIKSNLFTQLTEPNNSYYLNQHYTRDTIFFLVYIILIYFVS